MLRFRPNPEAASGRPRLSNGTNRQLHWKLWMLLVSLGLVVAAMRHLNDPDTAVRLGQIFSPAAETTDPTSAKSSAFIVGNQLEPSAQIIPAPVQSEQKPPKSEPQEQNAQESSNSTEPSNTESDDALAQVKDNTYFRPAESKAWFQLFGKLQRLDRTQLEALTLGELTYAQLLKQPLVYRGKVVTLRGTLRREEVETAPENDLGIEKYHRLVIQPRGGGNWPFVVYCLSLPEELPRGDNLQSHVAVTGFFFKNWSYAWQDGLGVAPVVLASHLAWQTPSASAFPPRRQTLSTLGTPTILAIACGFAVIIVLVVLRNTRRPRRSAVSHIDVTLPSEEMLAEPVEQGLQNLSRGETNR